MNNSDDQIFQLETHLIQANPQQPRGVLTSDSLQELAASIREHGILEPLVVAKTPAGYILIAGERRWRAAKVVGLSKVPVVIKETTPQGILEMSIVENVQREDLNPIEKALAYKRLIEEFGLGTNEVAKKVSKSAPTISNTIRLLTLPDAIKDALVAGVITEGHVRPLISLGDSSLMLDLFKRILRENSTVRQTEDAARKLKGQLDKEPHSSTTKIHIPELDEMAKSIQERFDTRRVAISQSRSLAKIIIEIKGDLEVTTPKLKEIAAILTRKS